MEIAEAAEEGNDAGVVVGCRTTGVAARGRRAGRPWDGGAWLVGVLVEGCVRVIEEERADALILAREGMYRRWAWGSAMGRCLHWR